MGIISCSDEVITDLLAKKDSKVVAFDIGSVYSYPAGSPSSIDLSAAGTIKKTSYLDGVETFILYAGDNESKIIPGVLHHCIKTLKSEYGKKITADSILVEFGNVMDIKEILSLAYYLAAEFPDKTIIVKDSEVDVSTFDYKNRNILTTDFFKGKKKKGGTNFKFDKEEIKFK